MRHPWMRGGAEANTAPLEDVAENLRRFGQARRRLKALLLATMLGLDKRLAAAPAANEDDELPGSDRDQVAPRRGGVVREGRESQGSKREEGRER